MASKTLVYLAKAAAKDAAKAADSNRAWVEAFREEYGHDDISDVLVEVIYYSHGDLSNLTAEFIDAHSAPGAS